MSRLSHARVLFAIGAALLGAAGCPAALDDGFRTVPASGVVASGGAGDGGSGSAGRAVTDASTDPGVDAGDGSGGRGGSAGSGGGVGSGGAGAEDGGTDALVPDPCARCASTETCCDGRCVDLRFDQANCRACGRGCPGTTCDNSSCTNTCAQGFVDCNRNVVDGCEVNAAVDPENCGNCGIACGFQLECAGGNCVCPEHTADCDGLKDNGCETDTSSNGQSCGQCGVTCGANQVCVGGACVCATGFDDCNHLADDGCEASLAADSTCGSCSVDCGDNGACLAGGTCGCKTGFLDCDDTVPGCETSANDPKHCGSCTKSCSAAAPSCDGKTCGVGCGTGTACGASCVDTKTDPLNCGGCGNAVGKNRICVAGKPACASGFIDCDGVASDCETNSQTDANHCGVCGTACKPGAVCSAGACTCSPATPNDCGGACRQCCSDAQCSDGNSCTADTCAGGVCISGTVCAGGGKCCAGAGCFACCSDGDCGAGQVCSGNQCITLTCVPPQIPCGNQCVSPATDARNCGACGNDCGAGRTCAASSCTPRWVALAAPPAGFVAREKAAHAAAGSRVFVWGGADANGADLGDAAFYDLGSDSWSLAVQTGAVPSPRVLATAVWTGSAFVVWGGGDAAGSTDLATGGRYDPSTGSWSAVSSTGALGPRRAPHGFWTGSRVLFYGGTTHTGAAVPGAALYDPANDRWSALTTTNEPAAALDPVVAWTGGSLLLFGGQVGGNGVGKAYSLDPTQNSWTQLASGPSSRWGAFGTWDGALFGVWSGGSPGLKSDGKLYEPVTKKWSGMQTNGAPSLRWASHRQTGWSMRVSSGATLILGGLGSTSTTFFVNGGMYFSTTNAWSSVEAWPSGASHLWGVAAWANTEVVLWGGRVGTGAGLTSAGERFRP
ncbi:MAG TPA: kelch repeat-containing protein [Polyangiaceae bacterium]|nr:kelch repeat-containing protein [Polyangiaceae bacterium]